MNDNEKQELKKIGKEIRRCGRLLKQKKAAAALSNRGERLQSIEFDYWMNRYRLIAGEPYQDGGK